MLNLWFWLKQVGSTLEKNFTNTKTKLSCLSEYLLKLFFPLSYLYQELSYGLTMTDRTPTHMFNQNRSRLFFASQEARIGQSVHTRKKRKSKTNPISKYPPHTYSSTFLGPKAVENFQTRLFDGLYTFWQNKRLRAGFITLLIIAPASKFFYLLLPMDGFGEYFIDWGFLKIPNTIEVQDLTVDPDVRPGWFFITFYYYFWSLGDLLAPTISILGMFLLFPKNYYPSYLVGVPFGYYLSMLFHRMFMVDSDEALHQGAGTFMIIVFLLVGVVIFIISDKVLFKEHHRKRASEARIIGVINMPGMSWEDKELILKKEAADALKHSNELYDRDDL